MYRAGIKPVKKYSSVYIIVRGTGMLPALGDLNTSALSERNVIKPEIR